MKPEPIAENTAAQVGTMLPKILETLAPVPQSAITPLPPCALREKRRRWLDKWLRLKRTCSALDAVEDAVWDFCRDYSKNPRRGRRLLLYGGNGCGKSHCAKAIHYYAQRIAMKIPFDPVTFGDQDVQLATSEYIFWPGIVDGFKRGEWGAIDEGMIKSLLVIDDVGAEHDPSGVAKEKLYTILERRASRWTVITTNCPPAAWDKKFERRIASRFFRNFQHLDMSTVPDFATT